MLSFSCLQPTQRPRQIMQRIGLFIIPGVIAVVLFIAINSFDSITSESNSQPEKQNLNFNAYSEGINTILYDAQGNINYTLQAERQVHFNDNATELEKPYIRLYQDGDSRWNIVANSGRISSAETNDKTTVDTIELAGNVQVYGLDAFGNRTLMSTEFLTLNPDLEILETDNPVSVVTDTFHQSSIGMIANLKLDEVTFLRDIKGKYEQKTN